MTYEISNLTKQKEQYKELSPALQFHKCPLCKKNLEIKLNFESLEQQYGAMDGIIPHIILHGKPLHAMLCYVDKHMAVRGKEYVISMSISKDYNTYQEFTRLWSHSKLECIE
jgi:hypothetical protein